MRLINLTGDVFGELTVIGRVENRRGGEARWFCRCSCGGSTVSTSSNLRRGKATSCGCARAKFNRAVRTSHGGRHSPEYEIWCSMIKRRSGNWRSPAVAHGFRSIPARRRTAPVARPEPRQDRQRRQLRARKCPVGHSERTGEQPTATARKGADDMTTATDWDVRDRETNDRLTVTDVQARIDQLDGAATEAPVQAIEPWVAKTPAAITPTPTCGRCGGPETGRTPRTADSEIPARTWARMSGAREWPQIPGTALTEYGRAQAEYDSAHQQIQDLRDLAFWAEREQRKIVSEISDEYLSRRAAMEDRYETEIARLHSEDDDATYAAYVQALPDYVRGNTTTVATERHASVYSELTPERIHADVPPDDRVQRMIDEPERYFAEARERAQQEVDRTDVQRMTERVQRRAIAPAEPEPSQPEPWWRRNSEWLYSGAIGLCLFGAIGIALVVLA